MNPIIDPVRTAAREAVQSVSSLVGINSLPNSLVRQAMKNMTEQDLDLLANEYGVDQVMHLIRQTYGGKHAN